MSQDTFPFADTDEAGFVDEGESSNRKAVLVAGGVAAALVLGVGGWFFLGGSSDDASLNDSSFVPAKPRTVAAAPKVAAKTAKKLPVAYKAPLGRDPFKALYIVPAAAAAPATGTTSSGSTSTSTTSTATSTSGTSTSPTSTTPTGTTRYTLKLVSISTPKPGEVRFFTWQVAGATKTVIGGQRFGKFGEIVVLAYETNDAGKVIGAVIQVGDDSPLDVKIGESVSVL
jgi:hypothetical protein